MQSGEVMALVGENGAGKSTLLRILSGDHRPDAGRLVIDGRPVTFGGPSDAHRAGIRVVYQEPEIVPYVSVAENIYIGALPHRGHRFDRRALMAKAGAYIDRLGFTHVLDPTTQGIDLSPAQRQLVEILRSVTSEPKVLALDEPTSSLSDTEVDLLFDLIGRLRSHGVAIIYVSHRMNEIFRVADRVAVLRDGALVGVRPPAATSEGELVRMMTGRDLSKLFVRQRGAPGPAVLSVRGLTTDDVSEVSFDVRAGEVVGMAGLVGAGRSELAHARVVRRSDERRVASRFVDQLRIRTPSLEQEVRNLSGGNQQKTVLARWLARHPKVLILDEPTRGVDVGAKAEIYSIINQLAADGMALLVISSEMPEVLGLADRILVMQAGRITGELDGASATEEAILTLAMADHLSTQGAS